jgi:hypothetical protein
VILIDTGGYRLNAVLPALPISIEMPGRNGTVSHPVVPNW